MRIDVVGENIEFHAKSKENNPFLMPLKIVITQPRTIFLKKVDTPMNTSHLSHFDGAFYLKIISIFQFLL